MSARLGTAIAAGAALSAPAGGAAAHALLAPGENPWAAWTFTPEIAGGLALAAGLYGAGLWRLRARTDRARLWRHLAFFAGLGALLAALQSPIEAIAERDFLVHQVQHLLLRMVGPMLVMLAAPQAVLIAGLPQGVRRRILAPVLANAAVARLFGLFARPAVATTLFILVLYFWQLPRFHNLALLSDPVHYLMHATMLAAGLVFFWRVFDARPAPAGTRYGVRLMMLWVAILAQILIGAYLALKDRVLYPAYAEIGRLWDVSALSDEQLGAATIWVPSSMMGLIAVLIVIHMWGRHETGAEARRRVRPGAADDGRPQSAAAMVRLTAPRNRVLALGFAAFAAAVFAMVIAIGLASRMWPPG